jgi:hypothetical protein
VKRREFITLFGGVMAAWPLAAGAQQPERMRRIGVLTPFAADDPEGQARLTAFMQGLQQLGWTDGRNLRIDIRWGAGDAERIRRNATELVALAPDVILAPGASTRAVIRVFLARRLLYTSQPPPAADAPDSQRARQKNRLCVNRLTIGAAGDMRMQITTFTRRRG